MSPRLPADQRAEADKRRLQRRSYVLLGSFLERSDLPVIPWVVSQWSLTANVTEHEGDQGDIVRAWADALGLHLDTHVFADYVRVTAVGKLDGKGGHVEVGITAAIYSNSEGGDECPGL
jgi:hypothetical protein